MNEVVLVGASKSLLKSKLGNIIDTYDVVCRMNSGGRPELLSGEYKEVVGSKKDLWLCKHTGLLLMYKDNNYKETVGFPDLNKKYFNILNEFNDFNSKLTCGITSIMYLLEKYNKIDICGFDGFEGGHWYGNKYLKNQDTSDTLAAKGEGAHDIIKEQEYINHLIQSGKIKRIDD